MLSPDARVALFYAPEADDPLSELGASWLGRDAATGEERPHPLPGLAEITADPRLYGLHATLKPPMRLQPGTGWEDVVEQASAVARAVRPFPLPRLELANLDGFLALREANPSMTLQALADLCVAWLDPLRVPPTEQELARRRRAELSRAQDAMLQRYGYPYVFATWRFHITLTHRLAAEQHEPIKLAAQRHFAPALDFERKVQSLSLFFQPAPGQPFVIRERIRLG